MKEASMNGSLWQTSMMAVLALCILCASMAAIVHGFCNLHGLKPKRPPGQSLHYVWVAQHDCRKGRSKGFEIKKEDTCTHRTRQMLPFETVGCRAQVSRIPEAPYEIRRRENHSAAKNRHLQIHHRRPLECLFADVPGTDQNCRQPADNGFALLDVLLALMVICVAITILYACTSAVFKASGIHVDPLLETRWYG